SPAASGVSGTVPEETRRPAALALARSRSFVMRVVIFGAGAIGATIAEMLAAAGGYRVAVADRDSAALARLRPRGLELRQVDVADRTFLLDAARGHDAVVSALPFFLNRAVAEAALAARAHYLDLTEDVATTRAVR